AWKMCCRSILLTRRRKGVWRHSRRRPGRNPNPPHQLRRPLRQPPVHLTAVSTATRSLERASTATLMAAVQTRCLAPGGEGSTLLTALPQPPPPAWIGTGAAALPYTAVGKKSNCQAPRNTTTGCLACNWVGTVQPAMRVSEVASIRALIHPAGRSHLPSTTPPTLLVRQPPGRPVLSETLTPPARPPSAAILLVAPTTCSTLAASTPLVAAVLSARRAAPIRLRRLTRSTNLHPQPKPLRPPPIPPTRIRWLTCSAACQGQALPRPGRPLRRHLCLPAATRLARLSSVYVGVRHLPWTMISARQAPHRAGLRSPARVHRGCKSTLRPFPRRFSPPNEGARAVAVVPGSS